MKLYYLPGACSLVPHTALHWIGVKHEAVSVPREELKGPEYLAKNPAGSVPTLDDDGFILVQNIAILTYLDSKYAGAELFGAQGNTQQRALAYRWLAYVNADVHKLFPPLFRKPEYIGDDEAQYEALKKETHQKIINTLQIAENHLSDREYLIDQICIADIYLYTVLTWCDRLGINLESLPNLKRYAQRVAEFEPLNKAIAHEAEQA